MVKIARNLFSWYAIIVKRGRYMSAFKTNFPHMGILMPRAQVNTIAGGPYIGCGGENPMPSEHSEYFTEETTPLPFKMNPRDIGAQTSRAYSYIFGDEWGPKLEKSKQQLQKLYRMLSAGTEINQAAFSAKAAEWFHAVLEMFVSGPIQVDNVASVDLVDLLAEDAVCLGAFKNYIRDHNFQEGMEFFARYLPGEEYLGGEDEFDEQDLEESATNLFYYRIARCAKRSDEIGERARVVLEGLAAMGDILAIVRLSEILHMKGTPEASDTSSLGMQKVREYDEAGRIGFQIIQRFMKRLDWFGENVDSMFDSMIDGSATWKEMFLELLDHADDISDALNDLVRYIDEHPRMDEAVDSLIKIGVGDELTNLLLEVISISGAVSTLYLWTKLVELEQQGDPLPNEMESLLRLTTLRITAAKQEMPPGKFSGEDEAVLLMRILKTLRGKDFARIEKNLQTLRAKAEAKGAEVIPFDDDPETDDR